MIIELMDGTQIVNVRNVYGGPKLIDGVVRDTLRIEIDISESIEDIENILFNNPNTMKMYTFNTIINDDKSVTEEKVLMCEGYNIGVYIKKVEKVIPHKPGFLLPDEKIEIIEVMMAQLIYDEYINGGD